MRILNPKFALAALFFAWLVWLAMNGTLNKFVGYAMPQSKPKSVMGGLND